MIDETTILTDLNQALIAARNDEGFTAETLPIKFHGNGSFEVPNSGKYLETVFIPVGEQDRYYGANQVQRGLYRVILHWSFDQGGAYDPLTLIRSIVDRGFAKGKLTDNVTVQSRPKLMSLLESDTDIGYPMSIRFTSFA